MKPMTFSKAACAVMLGVLLSDAARLVLVALYDLALKSVSK